MFVGQELSLFLRQDQFDVAEVSLATLIVEYYLCLSMNALIDLELGVADRLDHCLLIALRRGASHTMACDHFNVF